MELVKNLKRTLENLGQDVAQLESFNRAMESQRTELNHKITILKHRNMELQRALCRCRDMIEDLMNATAPNQLQHDAKIYLSILEGVISDQVINQYEEYTEHMRKIYAQQAGMKEGKE
jgi:Mg2+ and Co2+ transporter CorA